MAVKTNEDSPSSLSQPGLSWGQIVIATTAVGLFFLFGYLFVKSMWQKQWIAATVFLAFCLGSIPWVVVDYRYRDRLSGSIVIVLATTSAAVAQFAFFYMFSFHWFERIFNDKGNGEIGMMLFGTVGFLLGGMLGWKIVYCTALPSKSERALDREDRNGVDSAESHDVEPSKSQRDE